MRTLLIPIMLASVCAAQSVSTQQLLQMARLRSAGLEQAMRDTLGADNIRKGSAAAGEMGDFVFAVTAEKGPSLQIDNEPPIPAFKAGSLWVVETHLNTANALKFKGYDYHFSFGVGEHNNAHGAAELPEALTWLWRDYDPAKKSQEFVQEPAEKDQPVWRVVQLNRK
jgi:hypothetical protein